MIKRELPPLIAIAVILLGLSIATLLLPDREFSPNENRVLQQAPALTKERVFSGKFTAEAEKYESDQIALRDVWMGTASWFQRLAGKQDIGGVYLGRDGYFFARLTENEFNQKQYEKNLQLVAMFFDDNKDVDCRILLVPSPSTVLSDLLPANAPMYDAAARHDQLAQAVGEDRVIDVRGALSALDQPYYRTDHHWTTEGAQSAYGVWCDATGHTRRSMPLTPATDSFRGTLYSKVLLPDSAWDTISLAEGAAVRSVDCGGTVTDSMYDRDKLSEKDKYAVFFGGNWPRVTIDTGVKNGKTLLVVKDSFANSFVPFLTEDYETIIMLDLRSYTDSVSDLIAGENVTDVLVLYEMSNFAADTNLFWLAF